MRLGARAFENVSESVGKRKEREKVGKFGLIETINSR